MPSLIPNYIARLRTHSQSTAASSSSHSGSRSNSTAGPSTPGSELARLAADPPTAGQSASNVDTAPQAQLARKIHPDPSALLDDNAPLESIAETLGPRPPRGRSRSAEQLARMRPEAVSQEQQDAGAEAGTTEAPASPRSRLLSRFLSAPLLGGSPTPAADAEPDTSGEGTHWSTFGRRRPLVSAVGEFGSLYRRGSGSKSSAQSKSSRPRQQPSTPTATRPPSNTPSRTQTTASSNDTPPSQPHSPAGTMSSSSGSKSHSNHSHSVRSRRPPQSYPDPIPDTEPPQTPEHAPLLASSTSPFTPSPIIASPRPTKPTLDDSPQTFGRATPKRAGPPARAYPGLGSAFLPPLSSTPPPPEHQHRHHPLAPSTYPPRRGRGKGTRPVAGNTISFPSLPRARSTSGPRPRAEDVFQAGVSGRRTSADWSAAEAVRSEGGAWPASVSREMVMLALAGGAGDAAEVGEAGVLREEAVKNPTLFGSTGEDRMRFFRAGKRGTGTAAPAIASSSSTPHPSILKPAFSVSPPPDPAPGDGDGAGEGRSAPYLSVTAPTPTPSASPSGSRMGTTSDPTSGLRPELTGSAKSHGKRKVVDAEDDAPVDELGRKPRMSALTGSKGSSNRASDASQPPSSFRQSKRIRLSTPSHSPEHPARHAQSPPPSPHSRPPSSIRTLPNPRSLSQSSIPLRAIVSPRPPSIDRRSAYHMRDPALPPPRRQSTQWTGGARKKEEGRTAFPLQGWAFVVGFLLFPVWWVAAVVPVAWGWGLRRRGGQDGKGAWTAEEDLAVREEWEYDVAYTWRRRCRFMSLLGLLVYVPLIVLLAVLVPRT